MYLKIFVIFLWMVESADCAKLTKPKEYPLNNATHYWDMRLVNSQETYDAVNPIHRTMFKNHVTVRKHNQLGNVLQLDGEASWLEIPKLQDKCLTTVSCPQGMTFSFWMKFESGDYIMSAGRIAVSEEFMGGFRFQRDPLTNFFVLEIISEETQRMWTMYLKELPRTWFHFLFTWKSNEGARLYINGDLKLTRVLSEPASTNNVEQIKGLGELDAYKVSFGNIGSLRRMDKRGKYQLAHIAIWKKVLSASDVNKLYEMTVIQENDEKFCCNGKRNQLDLACAKWDTYPCICPELKKKMICGVPIIPILRPAEVKEKKGCVNLNPHCDKLVNTQLQGYCQNFADSSTECYSSCRCEPVTRMMASRQPKQHFSQEVLIFALLGCIGGLMLLFGIMFYFWKVYRTRYHGAFVPPSSQSNSLMDVPPDYDESKWPSKYVDSHAFFIKDVPPKKRALPLIPANKSSSYRYQPPEFD